MEWAALVRVLITYLLPVLLDWLQKLFEDTARSLKASGYTGSSVLDESGLRFRQEAFLQRARETLVARKEKVWRWVNWIGYWQASARLDYFDAVASCIRSHPGAFAESAVFGSLPPSLSEDNLNYLRDQLEANKRWL